MNEKELINLMEEYLDGFEGTADVIEIPANELRSLVNLYYFIKDKTEKQEATIKDFVDTFKQRHAM